MDCLGLLVCAAAEAGLQLKDEANYPRSPNSERILKRIAEVMDPVAWDNIHPGDVVLIRTRNGGRPTHFGIVDAQGWIVHASPGNGVRRHQAQRWERLIHSIWQVRP